MSQRELFEEDRGNVAEATFAIRRWLSETAGSSWVLIAKILSANDTLANETHQAGPYIPRQVILDLFPSMATTGELNPRRSFEVEVEPSGERRTATAIWYNNQVVADGTRNECRITGWGGRTSPLLDPDSTGALVLLAFHRPSGRDTDYCRVWVCSGLVEISVVEEVFGAVEPGRTHVLERGGSATIPRLAEPTSTAPCVLQPSEINPSWLEDFPRAAELLQMSVRRGASERHRSSDERLLRRRECEFALFRSIEEAVLLPRIRQGFDTVDEFIDFANSVTNRRKSRSGSSLGLHTSRIFQEDGLTHSYDAPSEGNKRPDFLFPSAEAYQKAKSPEHIRMLAAKTTCKDRWRQILNEADKLPQKHLLTLQEGVSLNQFREMEAAGVILVVPLRTQRKFHRDIQPKLVSLDQFIIETGAVCR